MDAISKPFPWRRTDTLAAVLILLLTAAAFAPIFANDFTNWDDTQHLLENPALNPPSLHNTLRFWREPYFNLYIPLTYTFWSALAALSGADASTPLNPLLFHLANLLLHLLSALAVFRILRLLIPHTRAAAVGALIFAIHPLQTEAVAWISGLRDLLSAALILLALHQYLLASTSHRSRYLLATLAFILAMLAKPTAVITPLIAWTLDAFLLHQPFRQTARRLIPWLLLTIPCILLTRLAQPQSSSLAIPLLARPLIAADALTFYLYKLFCPLSLAVDYGRHPAKVLSTHAICITSLIPLLLAIPLYLYRRKTPVLSTAALIFLIGLLPTLGLIPFEFQKISTVADRYAYISLFAASLTIAFLLSQTSRRTSWRLAILLLILWLALTCRQTTWWQTSQTLFQHALDVNPASVIAHNNLAAACVDDNNLDAAIAYCRRSIQLKPDQPMPYATLGAAFARQGKMDEALAAYRAGLQSVPNDSHILSALAGILAQRGQFSEAKTLCLRAIELDSQNAEAYLNLGTMLAQQGDLINAIPNLRQAVELSPHNPQAQANLATVLSAAHQAQQLPPQSNPHP